jgi:hypothetical protein
MHLLASELFVGFIRQIFVDTVELDIPRLASDRGLLVGKRATYLKTSLSLVDAE